MIKLWQETNRGLSAKAHERCCTAKMMTWQKYYKVPCSEGCCYSSLCGSINCSHCKKRLTCCPPLARYICLECEMYKEADIDTYCAECYMRPSLFKHDHEVKQFKKFYIFASEFIYYNTHTDLYGC